MDPIDGTVTYGGFSEAIVVDQRFVLRIPDALDQAQAAPLLCAGVTVFNPLRKHEIGVGSHVAVLGMGGLGQLGLQIAKAMGAEVTLITRSEDKAQEARSFGANHVVVTTVGTGLDMYKNRFDLILDTTPVDHDVNTYLSWLATGGVYVIVGQLTPLQEKLDIRTLILGGRSLEGSLVGGVQDTQDALNFCAEHGVSCTIETLDFSDANLALSRLQAGAAKYRLVLDMT